MGEVEQKDIRQQQMHEAGHLQIGEHIHSSATTLTHFRRVAHTLGGTGGATRGTWGCKGEKERHILIPLPLSGLSSMCSATSPRLWPGPVVTEAARDQGGSHLLPSPLCQGAPGLVNETWLSPLERGPTPSHCHSLACQEALAWG